MKNMMIWIMMLLALSMSALAVTTITVPTAGTILKGNVIFNGSVNNFNNTFNMSVTVVNATGVHEVACWAPNKAGNSTSYNCTVATASAPSRDGTAVVYQVNIYNQSGALGVKNQSYEVDNVAPTVSLSVPNTVIRAGQAIVAYDCSQSTDAVDSSLTYSIQASDKLNSPSTVIETQTSSTGDLSIESFLTQTTYNISCRVTDNAGTTSETSVEVSAGAPKGASVIIGQKVVQQQQTSNAMMLTYALLLIVPFVVLAGGYMMFGKKGKR